MDRSDLQSDYGFFIPEDELGTTIAHEGPIVLGPESPSRIEFPADTARVTFVGLDDERLRAASPHFDSSRVQTLGLTAQRSKLCEQGELSRDGARLTLAMPGSVEVATLDPDSDWTPNPPTEEVLTSIAKLSLDAPVDTTRCIDHPGLMFTHFGGLEHVLDRGDPLGDRTAKDDDLSFRAVFRLPDDRLLVASRLGVILVERGRAFENAPGRSVLVFDGSDDWQIWDMAVDPDPDRGNGDLRIFVSSRESEVLGPDTEGALFELRLDADGLALVGTSTRVPHPLENILLDPENGRVLIGAKLGIIYSGMPGEPIREIQLPAVSDKRAELYLTGLPARPYAISGITAGMLLFANRDLTDFEFQQGLPDGSSFRAFAAARTPSGTDYWVGDTLGRIFRRRASDDQWGEHLPRFGPRFAGCLTREPDCGWYENAKTLRGFTPLSPTNTDWMLAFLDTCGGVFILRDDQACSQIIPLEDQPLGVTDGDNDFKVFHVTDDWFTLASNDGRLFELRRL